VSINKIVKSYRKFIDKIIWGSAPALNTEYTKCPYEGMTTEKCHAYNNGECMNAFICER
jgi:hypothetical protein